MDFKSLFFNREDYILTKKEKIGGGAFGEVFLEKDKNGKNVAAKYLNVEHGFDTNQQIMFLYESTILQQLNHPSIVKFKGINFNPFNSTKIEPVIITEYYSNKSLNLILDDEKHSTAPECWSPTKKYIILLRICNALRYLHKKGVIHRDLKPENILLDENYNPIICDFGLSRCFPNSRDILITNTTTAGTPYYMAPELLREEQLITNKVDVYSFALIAFEIVTGQKPFENDSFAELSYQVLSGKRPKFETSDINETIKDLIERCWKQKAKERPTFEEIFSILSSNFSYSNEDFNKDEILEYLNEIKEDENKSNADEPEQIIEYPPYNLKKHINNNQQNNNDDDNDDDDNDNDDNGDKKSSSCKFSYLFIFLLLLSLICENLLIFVFNDKFQIFKNQLVKDSPYQDKYLYFGLNHILGNKNEYNPSKALSLFMESSEKGNCVGSYISGLMYENGNGVQQNFDKSLHYYNLSYKQNNQYGYFRIGTCYLNGYGVEPNYFRSFKYFGQLEKIGNPDAMNILGRLYENNIGNNGKTIEYFGKSPESENSLKSSIKNPFKQNFKKAIEYYEKASNLGNSEAMNNLGVLYENGKGVKSNLEKAIEYYEKASNLGNSEAMYNLGALYEYGKGVEKNSTKAFEYYNESAKLGNSMAKEKLK